MAMLNGRIPLQRLIPNIDHQIERIPHELAQDSAVMQTGIAEADEGASHASVPDAVLCRAFVLGRGSLAFAFEDRVSRSDPKRVVRGDGVIPSDEASTVVTRQNPQLGFGAGRLVRNVGAPTGRKITATSCAGCPDSLRTSWPAPVST